MTLREALAAAHVHSLGRGPDPAQAVARDVPRPEIMAKRAELDAVRARSHTARVQLAMLDRALAVPPSP